MTQEEFVSKMNDLMENEYTECVLQQANAMEWFIPDTRWMKDVLIEMINGILPENCQVNRHNVVLFGELSFSSPKVEINLLNVRYDKSKEPVSLSGELQFTH